MWEKIKETTKKWWKKFLLVIGIGAVAVLAATGGKDPTSRFLPSELLKAPKDRILNSQEIVIPQQTITATSTGKIIIIPAKTVVQYDYISNVEVPQASIAIDKKVIQEDLTKRTENSQHFKIGENKYQGKFFSGQPFYKDTDKWYQVETATTILEVWNLLTKPTVFENVKLFLRKFAGLPLAVMGTTTDYPVGTGDGRVQYSAATWAAARSASTGNAITNSNTAGTSVYDGRSFYRAFFPINTSAIGAGSTIVSAIWNFHSSDNEGIPILALVQASQADPTALALEDYDQCGALNNPDEGMVRQTFVANTQFNVSLNANGLSWITKDGWTLFGMRSSNDIDDSDPGAHKYGNISNSEDATEAYRPYLSVTYTLPVDPCTATSPIWNVPLSANCNITDYQQVNGTLNCFGSGSFVVNTGGTVVAEKMNCPGAITKGTGKIIIKDIP